MTPSNASSTPAPSTSCSCSPYCDCSSACACNGSCGCADTCYCGCHGGPVEAAGRDLRVLAALLTGVALGVAGTLVWQHRQLVQAHGAAAVALGMGAGNVLAARLARP